MNLSSNSFFIVIFLAILFSSCEGNTDRFWKISNESSGQIHVESISNFDNTEFKDSISSGALKTISMNSQLGGNSNPQLPTQAISSLIVINDAGDTLKKDYTLEENWESIIENTRKVPSNYEHEYILEVTDEDF